MTEPVKVNAPMATPSDISMRLCPWMDAGRADAEGLRRVERGRGDQHRGKADQRMEGGDELRHRRHRDAPRDDSADAAADGDAEHDEAERAPARRGDEQRRHDGDRHADHAEIVALPRCLRVRQAAQRQDEEDAGDEVEQRGDVGVDHLLRLLLVHGEHALGDEEAAENVDRGEHDAEEAECARPPMAADRHPAHRPGSTRTASSAPTTMTDEMALVTDISGVCSAGVTDQTT